MGKKISTGVYSGDSELYERALKQWGYEAQALQCIQEMAEFTIEITKKISGSLFRETNYLGELIDTQIMINQMVHRELNNPSYWMLRKQAIEKLKQRLEGPII